MVDRPSACPFCYGSWTRTEIMGAARHGGGYHMRCSQCGQEWDDVGASHAQRETLHRRQKMIDTRESVATDAAAWVLHHNYDDENDDTSRGDAVIPDKTKQLAEQIARRVLRHIDRLEGSELL
jgi:hypothetical protein